MVMLYHMQQYHLLEFKREEQDITSREKTTFVKE
jgi:hypothetical protein